MRAICSDCPRLMSGRGNSHLTPRLRELLSLIAEGDTTADMSHLLGISCQTVKNQVSGLLRRLGVRNRAHAVALYAALDGSWLYGLDLARNRVDSEVMAPGE